MLAVVDPLTTLTLPPRVTASCGMDILCHALESYTARHYRSYARRRPEQRAVYVGNNPVSDAFIEKALPLLSRSFRRAVLTGNDLDARTDMLLAASFAGMGFGNAGVHIPHACAPAGDRRADARHRPADGVADVGYGNADIPDLVASALKQQRILTMAPRDVMAEDLEAIFSNSMRNW